MGGQTLTVHYLDSGGSVRRAGAGDPAVLMLVHGMISSARQWRPTFEALRGTGTRVLALDLPGFGLSGSLPRPHCMRDYGEAVTGLARYLQVRPVLVGHSFGGMVAVTAQALEPRRFPAMVLAASAGLPHPQHRFPRWLRVPGLARVLVALVSTRPIGRWYFHRVVQGVDQGDARLVADLQWGIRHAREIYRAREFYRIPDFPGRLREIDCPVLVIWGRRDSLVPFADAAVFIEHLPEARLEVLDCGHLPMLERPREFAGMLARFSREKGAVPTG